MRASRADPRRSAYCCRQRKNTATRSAGLRVAVRCLDRESQRSETSALRQQDHRLGFTHGCGLRQLALGAGLDESTPRGIRSAENLRKEVLVPISMEDQLVSAFGLTAFHSGRYYENVGFGTCVSQNQRRAGAAARYGLLPRRHHLVPNYKLKRDICTHTYRLGAQRNRQHGCHARERQRNVISFVFIVLS